MFYIINLMIEEFEANDEIEEYELPKEAILTTEKKGFLPKVFYSLSFFDKVSFACLSLLVFLLPFFSLSFLGIDTGFLKIVLFVSLVSTGFVSFLLARLVDRKVSFLKEKTFWIFGAFIVVACLSSLFSSSRGMSFFGYGFEFGTTVSIIYMGVLMFISANFLKDRKLLDFIFGISVISFCIVGLLFIIRIFLPFQYLLGFPLGSKTAPFLGAWGDFGIYISFMTVLMLLARELLFKIKRYKKILSVIILFGCVLLMFAYSPFAWIILGFSALAIFSLKLLLLSEEKRKLPILSFCVVLLSILFVFSSLSLSVGKWAGTNKEDVRPNIQSTLGIIKGSLYKHPITGFGSNRFNEAWVELHSKDVTSSDYWNINFSFGAGVVPTFFVTNGIFGGILMLMFLVFIITKTAQKTKSHYEEKPFFISLLIVSSIIFVLFLLFVFGLVIATYFFIILGAVIAYLGESQSNEFNVGIKSKVFILVSIAICIIFIIFLYSIFSRFVGFIYYNKAFSPNTSNDIKIFYIEKAFNSTPNDFYARALSSAMYDKLTAILQNKNIEKESIKPELQNMISKIENYALFATKFDSKNSNNWQNMGILYSKMHMMGISNSFSNAVDAFEKAKFVDPYNPTPYISLGELYLYDKKYSEAESSFQGSLYVKENYEDGVLSLIDLYQERDGMSSALSYANSIKSNFIQSSPVLQKIGIIEYDSYLYKESLMDMNRAFLLDRNNDITRYYLGLIYTHLGRRSEALEMLGSIKDKYPDSNEIKDAYNNALSI